MGPSRGPAVWPRAAQYSRLEDRPAKRGPLMALEVSWWDRRDQADRGALGAAALGDGRAPLNVPGDAVEADQARTFFARAGLARQTRREWWQPPGLGESFYRFANRGSALAGQRARAARITHGATAPVWETASGGANRLAI